MAGISVIDRQPRARMVFDERLVPKGGVLTPANPVVDLVCGVIAACLVGILVLSLIMLALPKEPPAAPVKAPIGWTTGGAF